MALVTVPTATPVIRTERARAGRSRVSDPLVLLRLIRLASPSLPVGGFSYSEGLEGAVDDGLVTDEATCRQWLVDQLHLSLARSDLAVVAHAAVAWKARDAAMAAHLNGWVLQTRETAEFRQQTEQTGRSLVAWLKPAHGSESRVGELESFVPAPSWPVAYALAGVLAGGSTHDIALAFAAAWAENQAQAAMRAVPLGQAAAQRLIEALHPEIALAVRAALATPAGELQAWAPMLAIVSSRHEVQYSRLFRS